MHIKKYLNKILLISKAVAVYLVCMLVLQSLIIAAEAVNQAPQAPVVTPAPATPVVTPAPATPVVTPAPATLVVTPAPVTSVVTTAPAVNQPISLMPTPTNGSTNSNAKSYQDEKLSDFKEKVQPMGYVNDVTIAQLPNGNFLLSFKVTKSFLAEVKILNFPFRLLIDIPMPYGWIVPNDNVDKNIPVTLIESFRYGHPSKDIFRIVADLSRPVTLISIKMDPDRRAANNKAKVSTTSSSEGLYVLAIEFAYGNKSAMGLLNKSIAFHQDTESLKIIQEIAYTNDQKVIERSKQESNLLRLNSYLNEVTYLKPVVLYPERPVLIMIDPGHGGKDPGAHNVKTNIFEKDLVLEVSKYLKAFLETNPELSVVLTRSDDYYVPLKDRILWAETLSVDLFVSIHADTSSAGPLSSGMSVYTLSEVASDTQAQLLANNANKSDVIAGVDINKEDAVVNRILNSLYQRVKVNDSISLAQNIIMQSASTISLLINPLRSAGFAVLKVPNTPSVLIELGFLSSPKDSESFATTVYKQSLAQNISIGIIAYLFDRKLLSTLPSSIDLNALKNANAR